MQRMELSLPAKLPSNQQKLITEGEPVILEMAVTETTSPSPATLWAPVQWPIQGFDRGWQRSGVSQDRLRPRPLEPCPGPVAAARTEAGVLSVEQPALLSAIAPATAHLAAGGAIAGGAWDSARQPGRAAGVWAAAGMASPNGGRIRAIPNGAAGMVREELKRLGWKEADLAARRKGDREKLKLAVRLRAETAVTVKWIAERLRMGTWTHLTHLLYWHRRNPLG